MAVQPFHILVVDDDELAILNVQRALVRAGHGAVVSTASSGFEALAMLRGRMLPAGRLLVLTDLNMPGMSGIELLREIRSDPTLTELAVVVLTASTNEADRAAAFALHTAGFFIKSSSAPALQDVVQWLHTYWSGSELGAHGGVTDVES